MIESFKKAALTFATPAAFLGAGAAYATAWLGSVNPNLGIDVTQSRMIGTHIMTAATLVSSAPSLTLAFNRKSGLFGAAALTIIGSVIARNFGGMETLCSGAFVLGLAGGQASIGAFEKQDAKAHNKEVRENPLLPRPLNDNELKSEKYPKLRALSVAGYIIGGSCMIASVTIPELLNIALPIAQASNFIGSTLANGAFVTKSFTEKHWSDRALALTALGIIGDTLIARQEFLSGWTLEAIAGSAYYTWIGQQSLKKQPTDKPLMIAH